MKKFKVTFYTNVVYSTADSADQDQFVRYYEVPDNWTADEVSKLVQKELEVNSFLKDESSFYSSLFYKSADVTSFRVQEIKEEK